jgi:hypothetical protein
MAELLQTHSLWLEGVSQQDHLPAHCQSTGAGLQLGKHGAQVHVHTVTLEKGCG